MKFRHYDQSPIQYWSKVDSGRIASIDFTIEAGELGIRTWPLGPRCTMGSYFTYNNKE